MAAWMSPTELATHLRRRADAMDISAKGICALADHMADLERRVSALENHEPTTPDDGETYLDMLLRNSR